MDPHAILKHPVMTEAAFSALEMNNRLIFIVERKATKGQIRKAMEDLFEVKIEKVNTAILPDGKKKAFITLHEDSDAMELATRLGMF